MELPDKFINKLAGSPDIYVWHVRSVMKTLETLEHFHSGPIGCHKSANLVLDSACFALSIMTEDKDWREFLECLSDSTKPTYHYTSAYWTDTLV